MLSIAWPVVMPTLYAKAEIHAPRRIVWQALISKHNWFKWNTFLYDLSPDKALQQGNTVLLSIKRVPREEETEIQPRVMVVQTEACLHWLYLAPGIRNEHTFELQDLGGDRTQYVHREILAGPLGQLFFPFIRRNEQQGLYRMARELKHYTEQR